MSRQAAAPAAPLLGPADHARFVAVTDAWRHTAAATGPADRAAAERGARAAYRAAGLAEPQVLLWLDSPLQAAAAALVLTGRDAAVLAGPAGDAAAPLLDEVCARLAAAGAEPAAGGAGASVREAVRTRAWETARRRLHALLRPVGWAELWSMTGAGLWQQTQALTGRVRDAVTDTLAPPADQEVPAEQRKAAARAETAVRQALLDAVLGQHDAPWLAAFDAARSIPGHDGAPELDGLTAVARAAGWWWPYEHAVLLVERSTELHRDEAGRLDRGDGPALAYRDGFALHAWRGMPVPADFLAGLGGLTSERIRAEENAELRRVMLEHYGYDRYLAESGAEPLHRDETGVLWRIQLPDDEPVVMVEVVNSTPEPDGTHRVYWLRVPPATRTAREGVAWTFGTSGEDYRPQRET